jgi:hypothetical protein
MDVPGPPPADAERRVPGFWWTALREVVGTAAVCDPDKVLASQPPQPPAPV